MVKVKDVADYLNGELNFKNCCEWDNCGLLVGDGDNAVNAIGFSLDLTKETLTDAVNNGVNLIVTHHPVIFYPQKTFLRDNIAYEATVRGVSVISCHTCYDSAKGGVSEILAEKIGLKSIKILETEEKPYCVRIGKSEEFTPPEFALFISSVLGTTVRYVEGNRKINRVAVCGGSGGDFVGEVIGSGADAFVTGDLSHHHLLLAKDSGLTLIGAGHFETENLAVEPLMKRVKAKFSDIDMLILSQSNPVEFIRCEEN